MAARRSPRLQTPSAGNEDPEITRLREQVRLLTDEVIYLRSLTENNVLAREGPPMIKNKTPTQPGMLHATRLSCGCKTNCSTRICRCIESDMPCTESCTCADNLCQNSKEDKKNTNNLNYHQPPKRTNIMLQFGDAPEAGEAEARAVFKTEGDNGDYDGDDSINMEQRATSPDREKVTAMPVTADFDALEISPPTRVKKEPLELN